MEKRKYDAAAVMNGREYHTDWPLDRSFTDDLRKHRLVVVHAASDDLVEFEGAIYDERGEGEKIWVTSKGFPHNDCPEGDDCPNYKNAARYYIKGKYGRKWTFETNIPNIVKFNIMEDGEVFIEGFVFCLDDLG